MTAVFVVLLVAGLIAMQSVREGSPAGATPSRNPTARVVLDESFDGDRLDTSVWNTCHWWNDGGCTIASNDELEWYRPEQVSVSGGALHLTADDNPVRGSDGKDYRYRSGMVTTGPEKSNKDAAKRAWTYGRLEARLRVPAGRGLWPAVWLLPASGESRPEIDVLEVIGQDPGQNKMHLHPLDRNDESLGKDYRLKNGASLADGWHALALDWSPGKLTWLVDGKQVWQVTGSQVPDEPMYLVLNLAVGGVYPGDPDAETRFPAEFVLDYVRVTQN